MKCDRSYKVVKNSLLDQLTLYYKYYSTNVTLMVRFNNVQYYKRKRLTFDDGVKN